MRPTAQPLREFSHKSGAKIPIEFIYKGGSGEKVKIEVKPLYSESAFLRLHCAHGGVPTLSGRLRNSCDLWGH